MKKDQNIAIAVTSLFVIFIIIIFAYAIFRKTRPTNPQLPATTLSPTLSAVNAPIRPSGSQDYYTNPNKTSKYIPFASINPNRKVDNVQITKITGRLPSDMIKTPLYAYEFYESDKKYNPSLTMGANIHNNVLNIYTNPAGSLKKTFNVSAPQSNFAWITDDLMLLIEKNDVATNFYLINPQLGTKTFLTTGQAVTDGVNIKIGTIAFNKLKTCIVVLTSLTGEKWGLTLTQN